jgi:ribonuclease PH
LTRIDNRNPDQIRPVKITRDFIHQAEGSVLIEVGNTKVICTASVDEQVPPHLQDLSQGWVTAEYGMLPRATDTRNVREAARGKRSGRTHEIQRLIGRSLRAVTDLKALGPRTIWLDCDVIQADGGTRTAAITGAFVALVDAVKYMERKQLISRWPITDTVAAVSIGILDGCALLDLNYYEDSKADVDMNIVMTGNGQLVEIQGTAEGELFDEKQLIEMIDLARTGIKDLTIIQRDLIGETIIIDSQSKGT